ncbi:hypothetical protein D910_04357 [Dendroctonus ponderosae]|uniref:Medium-chain acyl-CoA ligase ACSF2, mitochondrial n=1 Tax=Dendroctonus ponderosae TaxID=77166 RepID=U4TZB7_DENPD|nr:hypothetical protein D910_04357 [Dendroctonus ponderosae]
MFLALWWPLAALYIMPPLWCFLRPPLIPINLWMQYAMRSNCPGGVVLSDLLFFHWCRCTMICGTPTMYVDLINRQQLRKLDIHPEIAISGGAPSSVHLFQEMKKHLNLRKVKSIYGLSESTAVAFQSLPDDDELHSTSTVGYVGDHLEVKIVDPEVRRDEDDGMPAPADQVLKKAFFQGKIVPRGTPGELLIRGYSTTLGYWQNEEKTNELIGRDKWLRTGDQFVLQEDGYGRIVGRIKDMIIRGGENIYPIEVEDVLNQHPHVLEVQVVGLPHERLGEEVCACIRVQKNMSVTLSDLKTHCAGKLARFKIPSRLEIFDSFPKTTSGKIQKHKIIETIVKERQFCN